LIFGSRFESKAAAIGLRHMFPSQTTRTVSIIS
jgi:hypothetical protein